MSTLSYQDLIIHEVKNLINEQISTELNRMESGGLANPDYAVYRERVGKIAAYRRALEMFEEAASNLEKRD